MAALSEKICSPYQRPSPSRPLLRPAQSNFPFLTAVILIQHKDSIGHFKVAVGGTEEAGSITDTRKLMRRGFADWAMEDHRTLPRRHYLINQITGDNGSGRAKLLPSPAARVCYCLAAPNGGASLKRKISAQ